MNQEKSNMGYSVYHSVLQSENTGRKILQPVKIAQLLGSSGRLQKDQGNSASTLSLPERITPYLKKTLNKKKNGTNIRTKLPYKERNARRYLKFTQASISATKVKKFASTNNINDNTEKENSRLFTRKSFLLPPNTIKELHIKNNTKRSKSVLPQFCRSTVNSDNINFKISEVPESSPVAENTNTLVNSVIHVKENEIFLQNISSQKFSEQSGINILHSSHSDLADTSNNIVEEIPKNLNSNISNTVKCKDQNNTNEEEYVTISKIQLTDLISELQHKICKLEEEISNLKSTLNDFMKISGINVMNKDKKKSEIKQEIKNLSNNTETMDNMDTKLRYIMINDIDAEHNNVLKESCKMPDINVSTCVETNTENNSEIQSLYHTHIAFENSKKNKEMNTPISKKQHKDPKSETKRRSARLRAKVLNNLNTANDSFVNLENELQIVNMESNTTITPFNNTPAKNKYKNQNLGRPLKEYMALKSRMSCLLTPNVKQLNSSESKNKTRKTDDRKASVSDKLLAELYNLYGD